MNRRQPKWLMNRVGVCFSLLWLAACTETASRSNPEAGAIFTDGHRVSLSTADGRTKVLYEPNEPGQSVRTEVSGDGKHFAVYAGKSFELYDRQGRLLSELTMKSPEIRHKLVGDEPHILVPLTISNGTGETRIVGFDVRDRTNRLVSKIEVDGVRFSSPSRDHLTLATESTVVRASIRGDIEWIFEERARKISVAAKADRTVVVPSFDSRQITHLDRGIAISKRTFDGPIWNIALSPSGRWSAATTQTQLHLFENGELRVSRKLPIAYAASVAINDNGDAVIGGQRANHQGLVLVCGKDGRIRDRLERGIDSHAFYPKVQFQNGGTHYTVKDQMDFTIREVTQ